VKRPLDSPSDGGPGPLKAAAAGAASVSVLAAGRLSAAEPSQKLAAALEKLPEKAIEGGRQVCKELLAGGRSVVQELISLVGDEFGDPAGVKPKYALHGLVMYASRPKADDERKMVAETLAAELKPDRSPELQAFIARQLQWCGRAEEVPALARLLTGERLCEPAAQALLAIGGKEATAALRKALGGATGKRRVTIVKALGRLRDASSARAVRKDAGSNDRNLRLVALYALGNMPDPAAIPIELDAADVKGRFERSQAVDASLRLARRLAAEGNTEDAEKICRHFLSTRKAPEDVHDRCAALHDLAMSAGVKAVDDVMAALNSKELKYLVPAARTAVKLARLIRKDHRAEAEKLLKEVLKATGEKAVLQEAEVLLGKAGA